MQPVSISAREVPTPAVASLGTLRSLAPGMLLVRQFDPCGPMYLILSGVVRVLRMTPTARPVELARLGEGDHVGEIAALLNVPRSASVEAVTEVQAIELSPEEARGLAQQYPAFAEALAETISTRSASDRGRKAHCGEHFVGHGPRQQFD